MSKKIRLKRVAFRQTLETVLASLRFDVVGCWLWPGAQTTSGHGTVSFEGRSRRVHRLVYQELVGTIPDDFDLHHICEVKTCCNPGHLLPLEHVEHCKIPLNRTHCKKSGHPLSKKNYLVMKDGKRRCIDCEAERTAMRAERGDFRAQYAKKKGLTDGIP